MLDLIYKTLLTIINKENQGYISPTEFNILANNVQLEIFRSYFEDESRDKNKKNRGFINKGYSNLDFNDRQRINQFSAITTITKTGDIFILPNDLYFIEDDGVMHNDILSSGETQDLDDSEIVYTEPRNVIEEVERSSINYMTKSIAKPTMTYPVYERYADHLIVYPANIQNIQVRYIRKPKMPQWTYFVLPNGSEVFNPANSSFQDFELHESEFSNIVNRMLTYFGINLREQEIVQIAETLKDKLSIKDNQ